MKRILLNMLAVAAAFAAGALVENLANYAPRAAAPPPVSQTPPVEDASVERESLERDQESDLRAPAKQSETYACWKDAAKSRVVFGHNRKKFNPSATYYPAQDLPAAFRDFVGIEINVSDEGSTVYLVNAAAEPYRLAYTSSGTITNLGANLTFIRNSLEHDEYRFEGEFLRHGEMWDAPENTAVLKGKLQKIYNGVKIAETKVSFIVETEGC